MPEVTAPDAIASAAPSGVTCRMPISKALVATASGKLRKKLSAFMRTGSPSRRPRSE